MDIHIFNLDTDYALGCHGDYYTPPASVVRLRKDMALFPATYAHSNDAIALVDSLDDAILKKSPYYGIVRRKGIDVIGLRELSHFLTRPELDSRSVRILPWGWNMSLRRLLLRHGVPTVFLKSENEVEAIRRLAHRRTTIPVQREMARILPTLRIVEAHEFSDENEALCFAKENPRAYFKMPWSSSGRGVVCSSEMNGEKLREWIHGAIMRQGCVIGEHGYNRTADFATEWTCSGGHAHFVGLSWFSTSTNGHYLHNESLPQEEIEKKIRSISHLWGKDIIEAQREALNSIIAPHYEGPLGIDMLADTDGNINPCVEINIRMTMGMAAILKN